mmetsp:Transcript_38142/g.77152  ORF Transcript_38142/g.77152 Transcript_38142/m.77152 type:complete len:337 (+) Transcript_38142:144-1154(+)
MEIFSKKRTIFQKTITTAPNLEKFVSRIHFRVNCKNTYFKPKKFLNDIKPFFLKKFGFFTPYKTPTKFFFLKRLFSWKAIALKTRYSLYNPFYVKLFLFHFLGKKQISFSKNFSLLLIVFLHFYRNLLRQNLAFFFKGEKKKKKKSSPLLRIKILATFVKNLILQSQKTESKVNFLVVLTILFNKKFEGIRKKNKIFLFAFFWLFILKIIFQQNRAPNDYEIHGLGFVFVEKVKDLQCNSLFPTFLNVKKKEVKYQKLIISLENFIFHPLLNQIKKLSFHDSKSGAKKYEQFPPKDTQSFINLHLNGLEYLSGKKVGLKKKKIRKNFKKTKIFFFF